MLLSNLGGGKGGRRWEGGEGDDGKEGGRRWEGRGRGKMRRREREDGKGGREKMERGGGRWTRQGTGQSCESPDRVLFSNLVIIGGVVTS